MKKTIMMALILCSAQFALSQTRVVGRIMDAEDNTPVSFAQVALFSITDTSLVAGTTTADNGTFTIERVRKGQYIFRALFVGYTPVEKIIDVTDESRPLALGRIDMRRGIELQGFEITEMFIPVQMRGDTIDYSAEAFRPVEGSALEELLKRLPGVEVDSDGKITVGGRDVSQILVEGERFFSDDPRVAARNIPADFVDRVQVFDRRSEQARFTGIDDGNEETVINLTFRPGMRKGWFGRMTGGVGSDLTSSNNQFRFSNDLNLNYFRDKDQLTILGGFNNVNNMGFTDFMGGDAGASMGGRGGGGGGRGGGQQVVVMSGGGGRGSAFSFMPGGGITTSVSPGINFVKKFDDKLSVGGSYAFSRSNRVFDQDLLRQNIMPDGTSQYYRERRESEMLTNQHRFNSEIRYTPNEDNELIIRPSLNYGTTQNFANTWYTTARQENMFDTINHGIINNFSEGESFSARLRTEYRRRLGKPRRTIAFELDGGLSSNNNINDNYSINEFFFPRANIDTVNQRVTVDGMRYNWSAQVAYTEPLIRDFTLELRYNVSNSVDNTDRQTWNFLKNERDDLFSNNYENTFFTQRFEARIQKNAEKYRYSIGLGIFPANNVSFVEGRPDLSHTQNVFNFAPQASYRYDFSRQSALNIRYWGRTRQPSVSQLQPVPDNSDPLNIRIGNPNLKPAFDHGFNITYNNFYPNFSSIFAALNVSMTQNSISNISIYNPKLFDVNKYPQLLGWDSLRPGARLIMADNVGFVYNVHGMLSYSTPILSQKITLSSTTGGGINETKSVVDKSDNRLQNLSLMENLRITYRLQGFDVSLNGRFQVNSARYSLQPDRNNTFFRTSGGADFTWQIISNKLTLSSDFSFSRIDGQSEGFNPRFNLWNAQLSLNVGKGNTGQIRLRVVDILNDNRNTQRNVRETFIEDVTYNTLQRYFLVAFTYNLNSALRRDAPQQDGVGRGMRQFTPHGMPGGVQHVIIRQGHP